jgi:hypothetical protein
MFRKVVRAAELLPPRRISNEDFAAICKTSDIAREMRAAARDFLDDAVNGFAEAITNAEALPSRKPDRLAIERAIADLRSAQHRLKRRTGPAGAMGSRVAGRHIAPALSVSWMRRHFPGDSATPNPIYWPPDERGGRDPFGGREPSRPIDTDALSEQQRIEFMATRGSAAIAALLGDIVDALDSGRRAIVQLPDGRKPLENRAYMLAALAELWHRLGRRPATGINSQFGSFSETVFEAIGWPTDGVNAALRDAIKLWRYLYSR